MVPADLAGGQGVAARQRADPAKPKDHVPPVHANGREGHPHGPQDVVHFIFVAHRIRIFLGDIRGAGDDLALDRVEDADAAIAVDEVDHLVPGRLQQFRMVQHHV